MDITNESKVQTLELKVRGDLKKAIERAKANQRRTLLSREL